MSKECDACGFPSSPVEPGNAAVALRSIPRIYRSGRDAQPGGPMVGAAGQAAAAMNALFADLTKVIATDTPVLSTSANAVWAPQDAGDEAGAIDRLMTVANAMADYAEGQPKDVWGRAGTRGDDAVTAGVLLREAVHCGIHRLKVTV